ncbi:hypothetical protein BC936DRAFT_148808 [Jimgerdemannia flammicorona]|nr:hypothetical protein BC936DRAFT_148808 [Jimgerdemannia flammicorona]
MSFPDGYFFIVSRLTAKVLQVENASKNPAARILLADHKPEEDPVRDTQLWFHQDGFLTNKNSGLVLDLERAGGFAGLFGQEAHVYQYHKKETDTTNQRWAYDQQQGYIYQLAHPEHVLDIKNADQPDHARAVVMDKKASTNSDGIDDRPRTQLWFLRPSDPQTAPDKIAHSHGWFGWMWHSKDRAMPSAQAMQDAHKQVYREKKANLAHELIAGAAAFEAVKAYEEKQKAAGKPTKHALAKEVIASLAAAEIVKLAEERGVGGDEKNNLQGMAVAAAYNFYDTKNT